MLDPRSLLPRDKHDTAAAEALIALDSRVIEPIIGDLFGWTLDGNWPVSRVLAPFVFRLYPANLAPIRSILNGPDITAKWHCVAHIIQHMPRSDATVLLPDLTRLAREPTSAETDEEVEGIAQEALDWLAAPAAPH